jgi:hypothetical protein
MPYKTRFREVAFPQTRGDWESIGYDANSLRSIGAAFYRELYTNNVFLYKVAKLESLVKSARDLANATGIIKHKELIYFLDGVQRAAKISPKSGEFNKVIEYSSRQIKDIKAQIEIKSDLRRITR